MAILLSVEQYDDGIKLESFIKKSFKFIGQSNLYKFIRTGQIRVNGSRVKANSHLSAGDIIRFPPFIECFNKSYYLTENHTSIINVNKKVDIIKSSIIFEDNNIIAINKPSGFASQGGSKVVFSLDKLINLIGNKCYLRLVHRLDKDTSGIMIFAKNLHVAQDLTDSFKRKQIQKTYLAICYGVFKNKVGIINSDILNGGKYFSAVTEYKVLSEYKGLMSFVKLQPKTGRKHQLRIHLSQIGHAIVGDRLHSTLKRLKDLYYNLGVHGDMSTLYLHSFNIKLQNPAYDISAPISGKYLEFLKQFFDTECIRQYLSSFPIVKKQ